MFYRILLFHTDNKFSPSVSSLENIEREKEKAVLIYTLLFPALVYNYAIFSQTSPYFFVPGDAPRSKSARHEGVVKSARPRLEAKVSSASPGVMTLWARPYAPGIASPLFFFFFPTFDPTLPLDVSSPFYLLFYG